MRNPQKYFVIAPNIVHSLDESSELAYNVDEYTERMDEYENFPLRTIS